MKKKIEIWKPKAKTCTRCQDYKKESESETRQCLKFKWIIPIELARTQAVCNLKEPIMPWSSIPL